MAAYNGNISNINGVSIIIIMASIMANGINVNNVMSGNMA
jgi:hypothetical protein